VDAVRPSSRRTITAAVEQRRDVDIEKQRLQREFAELQARRRREVEQIRNDSGEMQGPKQDTAEYKATWWRSQRSGRSALQKDNDGSGVADDVNPIGRPRKNIQNVRSLSAAAETEESESPTLVELLFPIGVLDKPPTKSVGSAGPEKGPASLMPLLAADDNAKMTIQEAGSRTPVDRDLVDQRSEARVVSERQARRRRSLRWGVTSSQNDSRHSNEENGAKTESVINLNARPKKGILKVRPVDDAATKKEKASSTTPVELLFPTGFLSKPPRSFRSSGPEHCPAFLMSVIADARKSKAPGSSSRARVVDRDLVDQWLEAKENSLRRGRYLRDYCPFRRDDDEESARVPEETTLPPEEAGPVEEVRPVKTGLPFDSPAAETEFVKAIVSRHLLKDDFTNRNAFKRSCERFAREQRLLGEKQALPAVARNVVVNAKLVERPLLAGM
jgi:hypothetical protein